MGMPVERGTSHSVSRLFVFTFILVGVLLTVAVLLPLGLLLLQVLDRIPGWWTLRYSIPGVVLWALVGAWALPRIFTIRVSAAGISGHDACGRRRFVAWQSMTRATRIGIASFRYVRVFEAGTRYPLWIPLYLASPHAFLAAVAESAPAGNPLRAAVEECLTSASS